MADNAKNSNEGPSEPCGEGRACAGESGAQSDSDTWAGSDPDDEFGALWDRLTDAQKKVAQESLFTATKADAARAVGLAPSTVYSWPGRVWEAASMLVDRRAQGLEEGLGALSNEALGVLRRALDPRRETSRVEKEAAEFIVNHRLGRPTQKSEVEVSGGIDLDDTDGEKLDELLGHLDEDGEGEG